MGRDILSRRIWYTSRGDFILMLVYLNIIARVSTCFVEYRMGKELPMGPIIEPTDAFYLKSNTEITSAYSKLKLKKHEQ